MQKKFIIIIILLLSNTFVSYGQLPNWQLELESEFYLNFAQGQFTETNEGISFAKKNALYEVSYYGEPIDTTILNFDFFLANFSWINTVFKREINNEEVYLVSIVRASTLLFAVFSLDGEQLSTPFELNNATIGVYGSFTNVFQKNNGDFDVFTKNDVFTLHLNNDYSWEITNTVAQPFSDIKSVKEAGNNYIITASTDGDGRAALLSANFSILWELTIPFSLRVGSQVVGGYIVCGTDELTGTTPTVKINNNGNIIWEENYPTNLVLDVIPWGEDILLAGRKVFTIDSNGALLWERNLPNNISESQPIFKIKKSQSGAAIMTNEGKVFLLNINSDAPFNEYQTIATNNIGSHISSWGNIDVEERDFTFPVNKATSTIFTSAPLFVGQTESGTLKGFYDFYDMGDDVTGVLSAAPTTWKIYQSEIDIIQQKLAAGIDLTAYSQAMLTYPAKGNPNCVIDGENITIDDELAPFIDVNEDGIYNMFDGDYPQIKGDQMIWWAIKHTNSELEIHGKWYAYQCGEHIVSNTVYVEYEVINTSIDNLPSCFFGKFVDFDLGCYSDDYIGSMPQVNSIFSYNNDFVDCEQGTGSYGTEIPIQSITMLDNDMASAMYYNSSAINFPATHAPSSLEEAANYLQASFRDGTPLTAGGKGYDPASTDFVQFVYPGNPANPNEWSMFSDSTNAVDQRMIAGTDAFSLNAGESKIFSFSYTTHPNVPHPAPDVTPIVATIQQIIDIYDNGNTFATVFLGQDQSIAPGESIILNAGDDGLDYVWSTNEDGMSIQVSEPGVYSVTVTDETGCQRSDEINISMLTGISDVEVTKLAVYPNPVKSGGQISIELPNMEDIAMVKLFNIIGQELYSEQRNEKTQQVDIKLSNTFSTGVYMVQLTNIEGKVMVGKVVVE